MTPDKDAMNTLAFSLGTGAREGADTHKKNNVYEQKRYLDTDCTRYNTTILP